MGKVTRTIVESIVLLLLRSKLGETVEVSKACYGTQGLSCTKHNLRCSNGIIAIQEAFYTDSAACGNGVTHCAGINVSNISLIYTRYNFSDTEQDSLNGNCSTHSACSLQAGRLYKSSLLTFSAIIYQCINVEVSKTCYGSQGLECTSHFLRCSSGSIAIQAAFFMESTACGDGISDCVDVNISSIPLNGTRYSFSDTELDLLHRNCSTQSKCSLGAGRRFPMFFSAIIYECIDTTTLKTTTPKTKLTTRRLGTTFKSLTTSTSSSLVPQDQTTITDIGSGGFFAGGLFTGIAIAAVIAGVVYFFYIRRRCVLKEPDPGPASPNHLTYTGLTDLGRPDTYAVIDRPEAVTRPSETSQAPVYQNMDDAS